MASSIILNLASTTSYSASFSIAKCSKPPTKFRTSTIRCIGWDPEGVLGPPQGGHIAKLEFKKLIEKDSSAKEAFERQVREEKQRRRSQRDSRVIPDTKEGLVEYFLDTEAQEIEVEIARLRPRINEEFFQHLKVELGKLRFAVSRTQDMEDRLIELEALEKALKEGTEAYDKLQAELVSAKTNLMTILTSKDIKTTVLEMVGKNELNRSLLTLLDENIASAHQSNQIEAANYMEKIRGVMVKYITK
ncbi:RNA processing factor [Lithospermum erythrorhizon]|uniref:RNA processing factor n=1 Tax=Lithospermum erythrorhizon TaxID=34254 RepID=A0AAV3Q1K9_LITER